MRVEGAKHFLTIKNAQMDDENKYSIFVDDNESTGKLTVDGKYHASHEYIHVGLAGHLKKC